MGPLVLGSINSTKQVHFTMLSLPIKVGMRFELGVVAPYFYLDAEGAILLSANQFSKRKSTTYFNELGPIVESTSEIAANFFFQPTLYA